MKPKANKSQTGIFKSMILAFLLTPLTGASVFVALLAMPSIVSAQACSVNCLRVYSIDVTDLGSSIRGIVKLTDETGSGAGARGTVVHAIWTKPDGSTLDQYANIGTRLRAQFSLYTAGVPGTYTITVADATKAGYTFDTVRPSLLSRTITVGSADNLPPTAVSNTDVTSGSAPLIVNFSSLGSTDTDGALVAYAWDFGDGNGSNEANPSHTYEGIGSFNATLTVTDDKGATASNSTIITVTDSNAGCISNCMTVDEILMSYKVQRSKVKGVVSLLDENGNKVNDAALHAEWTLPDGTTVHQYRNSRNRSNASFSLAVNGTGRYTLRIVSITKAGFSFDPDGSNVLNGSIDVTP